MVQKHIVCLLALGVISLPALAQPTKKKPDDGGQSRGTKQLAGGEGAFGVVYTLNTGMNFSLISAKYTLEPHNDYNGTLSKPDEKLIWLTFSVQNSEKLKDNEFGDLAVTLVDEDEKNYTPGSGTVMLASKGNAEFSVSLKPGQGVGLNPMKDELSCAIPIPAKARIKKIMLNNGRLNVPGEKVLRYNIAGFPGGSLKNVIAPLPAYAADPKDSSGATVAIPGKAVIGTYYPAGYFAERLDSVTFSEEALVDGAKPEEGKRYVVALFTAKNAFSKKITIFELGGLGESLVLRDTDGEKYKPASAMLRAKRAEKFEGNEEYEVGEELSFRYVFIVPKDAKLSTLNFGLGDNYGHEYRAEVK